MLKKNGQLILMVLKDINMMFLMLFFGLLMSCHSPKGSSSFIGKWNDVEKGGTIVTIDSVSNTITIDYSVNGGGVMKGSYKINNSNEIQSEVFPMGAKVDFDENGYLIFRPVVRSYTKDIESIYILKFKRIP